MKGMTKDQADAMRHALGLTRARKSYRNRYHATVGSPSAELWTELVKLGYAAVVHVERGLILFTVTPAGRLALSSNTRGGE